MGLKVFNTVIVILVSILVLSGSCLSAREMDIFKPVTFYYNQELMVHVRSVVDFLDMPLEWVPEEGKVYVNGWPLQGILLGGTYYVPVRDLTQSLNADYLWMEEYQEGALRVGNKVVHLRLPKPPAGSDVPKVYLTFDDGPNESIPTTLEILDIYGVKAVFFLVGENVLYFPEYAREIVARGHQIGNHSFSHPELTQLEPDRIERELFLTQAVFKEVLGVECRHFRPPYGDYNSEVIRIAAKLDLEAVLWTINPEDYLLPDVEVLLYIIREGLRPGANILLHSKFYTAQALPRIIELVWSLGYDFALLP